MSLDVYLMMPSACGTSSGRIYVRRNGRTEEVSRSEWHEMYPDRVVPVSVVMPDEDGEVYWRNITHNLGKMASEAGLYEAMWRPDEHGLTHARDLIGPLRDGLATLQSDSERFKAFNPENGWGDYDGLLAFAASYLAACMNWPDAEVRVSR
jgi:hypothetical protein